MELENPQQENRYSQRVQYLRTHYAIMTQEGQIALPNGKPTENILRKIEPNYQSHTVGTKSYVVTLTDGSKVLVSYELVRSTRRQESAKKRCSYSLDKETAIKKLFRKGLD